MKINGFGMFMFIVYPGAFVDMHSESLFSVSSWKQLRIFCAGIWHNVLIVLTGVVMLLSLPSLLSPAYSIHEHLVVVSHTEVSNKRAAGQNRPSRECEKFVRKRQCINKFTPGNLECI
mgnify:FL=1